MARSGLRSLAALFLAGLTLVAAGCGGGESSSAGGQPSTLRFAVTDLQGLEELKREFGPFVEELERRSGLQVEFFPVTDRTAASAALEADRVDMVFTGPAEYVVMRERTAVQPVVSINRADYHSCVYTNASSGARELSDLAGQKIAMSDVGSTSGHLGPSQLFADAGVRMPGGVEVLTVGDTFHQALKREDVAAVGIGCHDYEEAMEEEDDPAQYRVIADGPQLPADVVVAQEGTNPALVAKVRDAFAKHWGTLLPAMLKGDDNQKFEGATLEPAPRDSDYDPVRQMYRAIGVDDFSRFVGS